ncbi:hypothetical protein [Neolewinella antarctica]|uniref:tRNA modification GTPase n=1 Tax=Neolewinella antarctica TaxID=442734 RepID=A0ABX0XGM0_9BACT|nr:hypothetical protein [Neolewinella antarctica]NJC28351.1 hypothetical protein [Neolewinella antarctica]
MLRFLFALFITLLSISTYAQITFEKGYFIDNDGRRVDCLIKNVEWMNTPTRFRYKRSEEEPEKWAELGNVQEFGVTDQSRYLRAGVQLDRSSKNVQELSVYRAVDTTREVLFLEALVVGEASLYKYVSGNLLRFFFSTGDGPIKPLTYKKYLTSTMAVGTNDRYRFQLATEVFCPGASENSTANLDYSQRPLVDYFVRYNECRNEPFVAFTKTTSKSAFRLSIRPGIYSASLAYGLNNNGVRDVELSGLGYRLGVELEFNLAFHRNKWALLVEPTYHSLASTKNRNPGQTPEVNYSSFELPGGVRHYFYLNDKSAIFLNALYLLDFGKKKAITFSNDNGLNFGFQGSVAGGIGFRYGDKVIAEVRYQPGRDVLNSYGGFTSSFKTLSLIIGYSPF